MAAMALTYMGHPVLREVAAPVRKVSAEIKALVAQMMETMTLENGIGLAAPQVGVSKRVITVDLGHEGIRPFALVNPEIIKTSGEFTDEEGCLSIPGVFLQVKRFRKIRVKYRDLADRQQILDASDLLARVIQHEIDHLDGKLFVDLVEDMPSRDSALADYRARMGDRIVGEAKTSEAVTSEPA
ncbi:MAG: peptide deformylase [bacterium]|nr:peptide deformylase [bacterium]